MMSQLLLSDAEIGDGRYGRHITIIVKISMQAISKQELPNIEICIFKMVATTYVFALSYFIYYYMKTHN